MPIYCDNELGRVTDEGIETNRDGFIPARHAVSVGIARSRRYPILATMAIVGVAYLVSAGLVFVHPIIFSFSVWAIYWAITPKQYIRIRCTSGDYSYTIPKSNVLRNYITRQNPRQEFVEGIQELLRDREIISQYQ